VQYCRPDQRSIPGDQAHSAALKGYLQSQLLGIFDGRGVCLAMPLQPAVGEQQLQALYLRTGGGKNCVTQCCLGTCRHTTCQFMAMLRRLVSEFAAWRLTLHTQAQLCHLSSIAPDLAAGKI